MFPSLLLGLAIVQAAAPVRYPERLDLTYRLDDKGVRHVLRTPDDWLLRRRQVVAGLEAVMGPLPREDRRVPLDVKVIDEARVGTLVRRKISYQTDPDDRVTAYLFVPERKGNVRLPAVLCLHQTTKIGKDEPAGLGGNPDLHYALHLAQRGFVTIVPDYPSFGEHRYRFDAAPAYSSGSMKAVWDNLRAVDYLVSLAEVDPRRIGVIGHSLGGHNAIFTAVFDERIKAVVSSCGFTRFPKDDLPSWTGKNYMPRIATAYGNDAAQVPFDFPELIAALAPRPFLACAATGDDDFDIQGVRESIAAAATVYDLFDARDRLHARYTDAPHSFPLEAREDAYRFLERYLGCDDGDDARSE